MAGKVEAYSQYGVKLRNTEWSWSAANETLVVVTLWKHFFVPKSKPLTYIDPSNRGAIDTPANRDRIAHLKQARDRHAGLFRPVIAVAEDTSAAQLKAIDYYAQENLVLRLIELDEGTGAFRAVVEGAATAA